VRRTITAILSAFPLVALPGCDDTEAFVDRPVRGWTLTFADEFDGEANTPPDPTRWVHDVGGAGWGNNQLEHNTARVENAAHDGEGHLVITARREAYLGNDYTSARLKTQGLFSQAGGRFEARLKLPIGAGLWPAFWMLGDDITEVGWPLCGEIDIMEYRGQVPDNLIGSLHGPGYSGGSPISDTYFLPDGERFSDDFHVFAVEWDTNRIAWFIDDTLYHLVTPAQLPGGSRWVFESPFFMILNLAIGGSFVGNPDASTLFPAELIVDYVRAYERTP